MQYGRRERTRRQWHKAGIDFGARGGRSRAKRRNGNCAGDVPILFVFVVLFALASPVHAQRPLRLYLGETNVRQMTTSYSFSGERYSETSNPTYFHIGASYDVLRRGKSQEQARLYGSVYYDWAVNVEGYGGSGDGADGPRFLQDFAYSGGGVALRAHNYFGYIGAGIGAYSGGIGGKVFLGLQGRGSVFAEIALTRTAHDPPSALTTLIGIRL